MLLPFAFVLARIWSAFVYEPLDPFGNEAFAFFYLPQAIGAVVAGIVVMKCSEKIRELFIRVCFSPSLMLLLGSSSLLSATVLPGNPEFAYLIAVAGGLCRLLGRLQCALVFSRLDIKHIFLYSFGSFTLAAIFTSWLAVIPTVVICALVVPLPFFCAVLCRRCRLLLKNESNSSSSKDASRTISVAHLAPYLGVILVIGFIRGYFPDVASTAETLPFVLTVELLYKIIVPALLAVFFIWYSKRIDVDHTVLLLMVFALAALVVTFFGFTGSLVVARISDWMRWTISLVLYTVLIVFARSSNRHFLIVFGFGWGSYMIGQFIGNVAIVFLGDLVTTDIAVMCTAFCLSAFTVFSVLITAKPEGNEQALEVLLSGDFSIDEVHKILSPRCQRIAARYNLTKREEEILPTLCLGLPKSAIADRYFISENTVRAHVKRIYKKLDIHSYQELIELLWVKNTADKPQSVQSVDV